MDRTHEIAMVLAGDSPAPVVVAQPTVVVDAPKVLRTAWTALAVLDATTDGPVDAAARQRAARLLVTLLGELATALTPEGAAELARLVPHLDGAVPTEGELRILEAQLVGWLEGVMDGEHLAAVGAAVEAATRLAAAVSARQQPVESDDSVPPAAAAAGPGAGRPRRATAWSASGPSPYL